ncbi:inositol 145-trisphosphate receptor [Leishmania donovani]|uniref:Inositol_145-trisphosphate_receptor_putative/Gene DB:LmjF.16.0280 n=1 Tax=Leishmania donovani TaxID=5661 RepID=A0A6J8FBQ4_LEIDO|nr:inositol 145-trisphosphate receptor [Leishmania donovani]VDZ43503.1 inositol_145-trisphosphate_receptor_putative/GeneDB:LmjF.16.0280 [Leishmania donovani]
MATKENAGHNMPAQPLRYGSLISLYKQSLDGYVVATSSTEAPVGLQRDTPETPLRHEHTVLLLQHGDPVEASVNRQPDSDVVKYGQTIRLLHYAHQKYLGYHAERYAAGMKGNLRVLLETRRRDADVHERWRIMPRYRLRVEGEPVAAGDAIILQAAETERYLNVAPNVDEEAADSWFLEVSVGESIQGFLIHLYDGDCAPSRRGPPLRCGDCVTLLHTEEHKYVLADPAKQQCVLQTPDSNLAEGSEHTVAWYAASKEEVSYLSLFVIEGANASKGGALRTRGAGNVYRFKSLALGLYLQCGEVAAVESAEGGGAGLGPGVRQASYALSLTPHARSAGTLFQLHCASSNAEEFLGNGGRVFLSCVNSANQKVWVVAGGPVAAEGEDVRHSEVTIASLAHGARTYGVVTLLGRGLKSMRDGLEIRRLQPIALEELHMIRRLLPPLQRYVREMACGVGSPHHVRQAREKVQQLHQLCHRPADPDAENVSEELMNAGSACGGHGAVLNPEWQSKVFQQGVGELALLVVRASLQCPHVHAEKLGSLGMVYPQAGCSNGADSVAAASSFGAAAGGADVASAPSAASASGGSSLFVPMRYSELGDLVDACFELVGVLLYNRPRYAAALQSYADFVMECTRYVPSALRCVAAFYKDNPALVELPMARHRLEFFLEMLASRRHNPDVLHILRRFACCGGEGMVEAQRVILDCFTQNREMAQRVLCPMKWMPLPEGLETTRIAQMPRAEETSSALAAAGKERKGLMAEGGPTCVEFADTLCQLSAALFTDTREASVAGTVPAGECDASIGAASRQAPLSPASTLPPCSPAAAAPELSTSVRAVREVPMVGIPNSLFEEPEFSDSASLAATTQYRAKDNPLGQLLQKAADAPDVNGTTYFPLEGLLAVMPDWPEVRDTLVPYLAAQIHLLAALAYGEGHARSRPFIFEWVPRAVLAESLQSEALPRRLHGALLELFAKVMVDVDGALNIREQIQNIRCVVSLPGGGCGAAGATRAAVSSSCQMAMSKVPQELVAAKRFVVRYMKATLMSDDDSVAAEYLAALNLLDALVNAGAFQLSEYETLMRLVVRCVDPSCDEQRTYLEMQPVHDCKSRALQLMNLLIDVLLVREALWLVDCFRVWRRPTRFSQLAHINFAAALQQRSTEKWRVVDGGGDGADEEPGRRADVACDCDLDGVYKEEEREPREELIPIAEAFTALMELANCSRSSMLQRQVICVFFRATNFLEELYATASRVQLLTSEDSIGFYAAVNRTSIAVKQLAKASFRRSNTIALANSTLDALDDLLSKPTSGTVAEKLSMMQQVGLPLQLIRMLERVSVPVSEASRQLVFKAVAVLQTMAQSPGIRDELREAVVGAAPLAYQNTNYISLLRTLFVAEDDDCTEMPTQILADVVRCLYREHATLTAIEFLSDWVAAKRSSVHVMAQRQQQVWRAIVSDQQAERCIQLRHGWCSNQGRELRERLLTSDDCYAAKGRTRTHLDLCRLLYLVSNKSEFVKAETVRQEVFGQNSLDALLQVTTDVLVPVYFRYPYVQLLQALVLDDACAVPSLLAHRDFPDFVRLCMMDAARYLQLLGGRCALDEVSEELERREGATLWCVPKNEAEEEMEEALFGAGMYEDFFFGPLCACTERVCARYRGAISQLSNRVRSQLSVVVNELVDAMCDVLQFFFNMEDGILRGAPHSATGLPSATTAPFPEAQWSLAHFTALRQCLRVAKDNGFSGTARWRGDPFSRLYARLAAYVGAAAKPPNRATAAVSGESSAVVTPGVVLKGGDSCAWNSPIEAGGGAHVLASKWMDYLRSVLADDARMAEKNQLISGAGILLRCGARGATFMRTLFTVLPSLQHPNVVHTLTLIRQMVVLMPNNPYDDSVLLPLEEQESDVPHITVTTPVQSRQTFLARWAGDESLEMPLPLLALVGEFVGCDKADAQRAALLAGCTLLQQGHRGMQECYRAFCRRSANDRLLCVLRHHFLDFKDRLRTYHHALSSGSSPSEARHYLTQMSNCRLELKLLQLLCSGQYAPLQTYLVSQPESNISVNVVEALVELLSMAPKTANEVTSDFMVQLLSTIAEALQGPCAANQDMFVAYNAADYLTLLLSKFDASAHEDAALTAVEVVLPAVSWHEAVLGGGREGTSPTATLEERRRRCCSLLQTMALSTLLAMIEGRDDSRLASKLVSTVDLSLLTTAMDRSAASYEARHGPVERKQYNGLSRGDISESVAALRRYFRDYLHNDYPTSREELQDELALAVSIYAFFRACHDMHFLTATRLRCGSGGGVDAEDFAGALDELVDKKGQSIRQVLRRSKYYRQVSTKLAKIEIVRDGRLERVYFRALNSAVDNLFEFRRTALIQTAVRTSDNERIQHFFNETSDVIMEMSWYNSMRRFCAAYLLNFFLREINALGLLIVFSINLVMVIGIRAPTSPYSSGTPEGIDRALVGLGIVDMCVQGVLLTQALLGPAVVNYKIGWRTWYSRRQEELTRMSDADIAVDRADALLRGKQRLMPTWYERVWLSGYYAFWHAGFLPHFFFCFVSVMGFAQHRIWYALQMMQITINSPILANLFEALRANLKLLVLTYALLLTFVLVGANISYYNFSQLFDPLGARLNGFNCYTLSQCFLVHVDTLRSGGGIGDVTNWPVFYSKDGYAYWVMFYRIAYYLVVGLVGANLFLGVIIDSLTQHRTHQQLIQADQEKKCFICGIERNEFDIVRPGAYSTHVAEEHNMWQYIFFLHYLSKKDANSHTGQEAYVQQLIAQQDLSFYPIGHSLTLRFKDRGAVDAQMTEGGIPIGGEEEAEDGVPQVVAMATEAGGGDDADGKGAGGHGKNGGGALDGATAHLISSLVEAALKEGLEPLRRSIEKTNERIEEMRANLQH